MEENTIEVIETSKYWKDESTENKLSKSKYTKDEATKILEQLYNNECTKCVDCIDCVSCEECTNCERCANCSGCDDCSFCTNCNICDNCNDCSSCEACSYCEECTNCEFCIRTKESKECSHTNDCIDCIKCENCYDCKSCEECSNCSDLSYGKNETNDDSSYELSYEDEENGKYYLISLLLAGIFLGLIAYFVGHKDSDFGVLGKLSIGLPILFFFTGTLSSIFPDGDEEILIDGNTSSFNMFWGMILTIATLFGLAQVEYFNDKSSINGTVVLLFVGYFITSFIVTNKIIGYRYSFFTNYFRSLLTMVISMLVLGFIVKVFKFVIGLF